MANGRKAKKVVLAGLPVLWAHQNASQAIGLHVDEREVWAGWESGDIAVFDHRGKLLRRWKLPTGVDALVADEAWRYAGGHDGKVYDLTGTRPRVSYEVEGGRIHWVDVSRGNLCAADAEGALTVTDADGKLLFHAKPRGAKQGWMARADAAGVYLGNSRGVTRYDWKGKKVWHTATDPVGFGCQELERVYAFVGYWMPARRSAVVALDKRTGKVVGRGSCWSDEPHYDTSHNAASCASGRGGKVMYGATCDTLFAFDARGARLWEVSTQRLGAACSMAWHRLPSGEERLYVVTHLGQLACLDVSDAAVAKAKKTPGRVARAKPLKRVVVTASAVEVTKKAGKGVVVECVKEGSKVRVRVISKGYQPDWFCQFPRDLREVGAKYVVDEVREASQGGFYRALGDIKRLRG